jgi:predicted MPP superfamily phosphohydrolase
MRFPLRRILAVLLIIGSIASSASYYSGRQLCEGLAPDSPWRWAIWAFVILSWSFPIFMVLLTLLGREVPFRSAGYFLVGLAATLLLSLFVYDAARFAFSVASIYWPPKASLGVAAFSVGLSLLGLRAALAIPLVKKVSIPIAGLAKGLEGLRIVQISDVHISPGLDPGDVRRLVDQVQALKPDLIAVTGDLIDGPHAELRDLVLPFKELRAPLGTYFVTGNHEYIWDIKTWMPDLRALGFEILENAHRVVEYQGAKILIWGVNDISAGNFEPGQGPDAKAALAGAPQADFTLFLAHQPQAYKLVGDSPCDLLLAGHTHGGQFQPVSPIVSLFHRYFWGLYRHENKFWVYVNPGSGVWGPPNRFGVPTEITEFTLEKI